VFVADDPVVDCVLVVAPAPVTSARTGPIKLDNTHKKSTVIPIAIIIFFNTSTFS